MDSKDISFKKTCIEGKHVKTIDSFCETCKESACSCCRIDKHFEHGDTVKYKTGEIIDLVNYLAKLKTATSRALHIYSGIIKVSDSDKIAEQQENTIRQPYAQFRNFVKDHQLSCLWKIRLSRYVQKLRASYEETKPKNAMLEELKSEYKKRIQKLLEAVNKEKYDKRLIAMAGEEERNKMRADLDKNKNVIEELQHFSSQLNQLQKTEAKYSKDKVNLNSICQIPKIANLAGDKLILLRKNNKDLLACYPDTKKCETIQLNGPVLGNFIAPLNFSIADIGNVIYVIGGNKPNDNGANIFLNLVYAIDTEKKTVSNAASLKIPRRRAAAVAIRGERILTFGGDKGEDFLDSCEMYDVRTNTWVMAGALSEPKSNISATSYNNQYVYAFGGYNNVGFDLSTIERLDINNTAKWEVIKLSTPDHWKPIQNMGAIQIGLNDILLFGGMSEGKKLSQCLIYKVADRCFEKSTSMQGEDTFLQIKPKKSYSLVYAFGCHTLNLHIFNIRSKTWSIIPFKDWTEEKK